MKLTDHLSSDTLQAYLDRELDHSSRQEVERHLGKCPSCQEDLSRLVGIFARLENLPSLNLEKDFSSSVLTLLREDTKLSQGITWTLALEALAAGGVIGLLIPAVQAAAWLPQLVNTQTEIRAGINIFLAQLASSWLVWWAGLQLHIEQTIQSLFSARHFPSGAFSPWVLIMAAAGIGLLANFILLRSSPIRSRNQKR